MTVGELKHLLRNWHDDTKIMRIEGREPAGLFFPINKVLVTGGFAIDNYSNIYREHTGSGETILVII